MKATEALNAGDRIATTYAPKGLVVVVDANDEQYTIYRVGEDGDWTALERFTGTGDATGALLEWMMGA